MRGRNARGSNHARVESWTGVLRLGTATTLRRRVAPTRRGSRESLQKSRPTPCEPAVTGLEMGIRQRFAGGQQGATIGPKLFREWRIRGAERRVGPRSGHAASAGSRQPDLRVGGVELRARRTVVGFGRAPGRAPEPHTFRGPSSCPLPMKVPGFLDCGHSIEIGVRLLVTAALAEPQLPAGKARAEHKTQSLLAVHCRCRRPAS